MSTNLPQSQWLNRIAQGIEQPCPCATGGDPYPCEDCKGALIRPYAETGVAGWLRDRPCKECRVHYQTHSKVWGTECPSCNGSGKRGSEWPSMVWEIEYGYRRFQDTTELTWAEDDSKYTGNKEDYSYFHALDLLDAFALLEEVGWGFQYHTGWGWKAAQDWGSEGHIFETDSPEELLDKIMAEEEKHG